MAVIKNATSFTVNSANITEMASSEKTFHFWTDEETGLMLAKLKELEIYKYKDGRNLGGQLFKRVSDALSEACFTRTPEQIRARWKQVKSEYYKIKRKNQGSGHSQESCSHIEILHELLEQCPTVKSEEYDVQLNTAAEMSTNATVKTSSNQTSHFWTDKETGFMLAKLKELKINKYMDGRKKRNGHIFKRASCALSEAGFTRTAEQIRERFKNLKTAYYTVQRQNQDSSYSQQSCPHMDILHELLEECTTTQSEDNNVDIDAQTSPVTVTLTDTSSNQTSHFWSNEETGFMLAKLKELEINKYMDGRKNRNGHLFKRVSCALSEAGFTRTPEQIRMRWKHVKRTYNNVRRQNQDSGYSQESCPHMEILHELLEGRPTAQSEEPDVEMQSSAATATSTNTTEMASSNQASHFWTDEETGFMLTKLKELEITKYMDGRKNRNGHLFKRVSCALSEAGFTRTDEQIRMRWKHVTRTYYNVQRQNQDSSYSKESCPHMDILHELLEGRPTAQAEDPDVETRSNAATATSTDTMEVGSSSQSSHFWTDEETGFMLAKLKELEINKYMDGRKKRNGHLFKCASCALSEAGFTRTPEQIRMRWKHVKRTYYNVKRQKVENGHSQESCPHMEILHELLEGRPIAKSKEHDIRAQSNTAADMLPLSALRLHISPLQLMTAAMWGIVQRRAVMHYGLLEDFITTVLDIIPELLTHSERDQLLLGLRTKMVLEMCRSDDLCFHQNIEPHLKIMYNLINEKEPFSSKMKSSVDNFSKVVNKLLNDPNERNMFFQNTFPSVFGLNFDSVLCTLVRKFLNNFEKLLPVPSLDQTSLWLGLSPSVLKECGNILNQQEPLSKLIQHHKHGYECSPGHLVDDDSIFSSFYGQSDSEDDDKSIVTDVTLNDSDTDPQDCDTSIEFVYQRQSSSKKKFSCLVCDQSFVSLFEMKRHSISGCSANSLEENASSYVSGQEKNHLEDFEANSKHSHPSKRSGAESEPSEALDQSWSADIAEEQKCKKCSKCEETFTSPTDLTNHTGAHTEDVSHICGQCGKKIGNYENSVCKMSQAIDVDYNEKMPDGQKCLKECAVILKCISKNTSLFSYEECGQSFQGENFETHKLQCHSNSNVIEPCHVSSSASVNKGNTDSGPLLNQKSEESLDSSLLKQSTTHCTLCDETFSSLVLMRKHYSDLHNMKRSFQCPVCKRVFERLSDLVTHHQSKVLFQCGTCKRCFMSSLQLSNHRMNYNNDCTAQHICDICDKSYTDAVHLKKHKKSHKTETTTVCSYCGKKFCNKSSLQIHMNRHTGGFSCPICAKVFYQKTCLQRHIDRHNGQEPYLCEICGKRWATKAYLRLHMVQHSEERPFTCDQCGMTCKRESHLKEHIRSKHTEHRPFKCTYCNKAFKANYILKQHLIRHTGVRPFVCSRCGKSYHKRHELKNHIQNLCP